MTTMSPIFVLPLRVYIEDTDAGGIVFYANYLKYMERARTEYVRSRGVALRSQLGAGISYVVHSLELRYHQPARLDDELEVSAEIVDSGKSYLVFRQQVRQRENGTLCVEGHVKVACVALDTGKPRALPAEMQTLLSSP